MKNIKKITLTICIIAAILITGLGTALVFTAQEVGAIISGDVVAADLDTVEIQGYNKGLADGTEIYNSPGTLHIGDKISGLYFDKNIDMSTLEYSTYTNNIAIAVMHMRF